MIDSITRITLNLQETNTMVSIRVKRGDTGRKLLIHLSDGSIPYHISDDCYATFTAKKPDGTKINNPCTIENNVIEYEFTDQTCTAVGTMKAEIRLYGADDKIITSACFLVNVYDTVFRDGDEVGSETEMNTLDDLILRANAFLNETGKLLRWQGNWDSESEYEANDLVLHEDVLYVAEEAIAAGTVPGSEGVTAWVPIAGMGTGSGTGEWKIPTIAVRQFSDPVNGTGVEVTTTNYGADGSVSQNTALVKDGKNGVSPVISVVSVENVEAGDKPSGTIYGPTNHLTLKLKIPKGKAGDDYVLTDADKAEIAEMAADLVEVPEHSGGNVDQNAVLFTEQGLTDEQQTQARDNIGIEDLLTEEITGAFGINLNDGVYEIGRFGSTGNEYDNEGNYAFRNANYLPVEGGRTIVVYFDAAEWNGNKINWGVELVQYDSAKAVIGNAKHYIENYRNNSKSSFTLDANAAFIRIHYNRNGELVFEDMTAPKIAVYYLEDAVQEFVEYGVGAETVLMVRKDRVQGLVALAGKKIVYDGDSIGAGSAANAGGGYAKIIADMTNSACVNHAVGGGRLCSGVADRHCVADNLANLPTDGDIYCFQGGINDYWGNAVLGTYTPGDYTGVVDATTVCGALETIFRYALNNFPGKRVCFVITHKIQNTAYQKNGAGNTFLDYRNAMAGICQKYSIPFYDAFSESGLNGWNDAQNNLYLTGNTDGTPDGCHPNEEGYRLFYVDQLIELFESGRSSGSGEKGEPGKDGADGQPGKDGEPGKDGQPGKDGNDYILTPSDKEKIAEIAAGLVEVPEGSGGIAVTGATVGQTVKISAVDENGVPTAWVPTDFPSGGGSGGEEWVEFCSGYLTEPVSTISIRPDAQGVKELLVYGNFYMSGDTKCRLEINGRWTAGKYTESGMLGKWNAPFVYRQYFDEKNTTVHDFWIVNGSVSSRVSTDQFVFNSFPGVDFDAVVDGATFATNTSVFAYYKR